MSNSFFDKVVDVDKTTNVEAGSSSNGTVITDGCSIFFNGVVSEISIKDLNFNLIKLNRDIKVKLVDGFNPPDCIELYITSYGGSLLSGFQSIDIIESSDIPVKTIVSGYAASAGTLMSISGAHRVITKTSMMLLHQFSSSAFGTYEQIKDDIKNWEVYDKLIKNFYLRRTKLASEELDELLKHDYWLTSDVCLKMGLVDEVV